MYGGSELLLWPSRATIEPSDGCVLLFCVTGKATPGFTPVIIT